MARKALLIFALILISLTGLLALSGTLVEAAVSNLRVASATCGTATVTVAYDGNTGGTGTNQIRFSIKINATGTILFQSSQPVPGAAGDVSTIATWASQPESTVIQVLAEQIDSVNTVLSSNLVTYTCSSSGSQVGPTNTPGPGTPTATPVTTVGPTATPTPLNARDQEAARGVTRIYDDFTTAVIFRLPSGDVQYYHFPEPARFIGNTPAGVLNPALYPAGQLVAQYTAVDGWRVDLYFQGGNQWRAVFFDAAGQLRADAYFNYGNPAVGAVAQPQQLGQPQVIFPGIGNLANPFVPLQPVPVNLFPFVVVPQVQQQVIPVAPVQAVQPQVIPVPAGSGLTVAVRVSLSVRSGPSISAARLGVMPAGTQVALYARDSSGLWVYGAASNGLVGWMSARYLSANLAQILGLGVAQ